jgi:hypothetical protein
VGFGLEVAGERAMDASTPVDSLASVFIYLTGNAIACFAYLYVGVRLYRLSRRTRQTPEFLIAACFLLWVLSYLLYDIPYALVRSDELVPAVCAYSSQFALALGNAAFALFIRAVFRPDVRWATWLVAAIIVSLVVGLMGSAWTGDWEGVNPLANPGYWLDGFGALAPATWLGAEGFAHYFMARRRLKFGFCEPMDCNRFLLWGIAGALWLVLEGFFAASDLVFSLTGQWSDLLILGVALFEVVPVAVIGFIFFPPAFYCRWVEGRGKSSDAQAPMAD